MKELPEDLAAVGYAELSEQRAIRDDKLAPLFQRWPSRAAMSWVSFGSYTRSASGSPGIWGVVVSAASRRPQAG